MESRRRQSTYPEIVLENEFMVVLLGIQRFLSRHLGQRKEEQAGTFAMAETKLFELSGKLTRQRTLVRPLRQRPNEAASRKASRFQHSDGNHGAFPLDASTSAKQRTSLNTSCTSIGGGRGETKNWRLKKATLSRENAGVCQSLNSSAQS